MPDSNPENRRGEYGAAVKWLCLICFTAATVFLAARRGMSFEQTVSIGAFAMLIMATLFFWTFHLAFAFIGVAAMLFLNVLDLNALAEETKLDVILFLIGMMIIVGVLRDLGLFSWIITRVIAVRGMSGRMFVCLTCGLGVVMSCVVDEMAAVVLAAALVFQVADVLDVKPIPFVIMAVMAINIGSAGTMLGNPVGILIGQSASPPLSFNDFMIWSFPLMLVEFAAVLALLLWMYRRDIAAMNAKMEERRRSGLSLGPIVAVPHRTGLAILAVLLALLILHKGLENLLGLPPNTVLISSPVLLAGILLLWRRNRIRKYLEQDLEWVAILFFMLLFMIAGALERTGTTDYLAVLFVEAFGDRQEILIPAVLGISAVGSACIENIVFVAAFMPVVAKLEQTPLIWALLHGACLGGNITMMGSTANIMAVGMIEKRYWTHTNFFMWLKTGLAVALLSCLVAWAGLAILSGHMPTHAERVAAFEAERAGARMPGRGEPGR